MKNLLAWTDTYVVLEGVPLVRRILVWSAEVAYEPVASGVRRGGLQGTQQADPLPFALKWVFCLPELICPRCGQSRQPNSHADLEFALRGGAAR